MFYSKSLQLKNTQTMFVFNSILQTNQKSSQWTKILCKWKHCLTSWEGLAGSFRLSEGAGSYKCNGIFKTYPLNTPTSWLDIKWRGITIWSSFNSNEADLNPKVLLLNLSSDLVWYTPSTWEVAFYLSKLYTFFNKCLMGNRFSSIQFN